MQILKNMLKVDNLHAFI